MFYALKTHNDTKFDDSNVDSLTSLLDDIENVFDDFDQRESKHNFFFYKFIN